MPVKSFNELDFVFLLSHSNEIGISIHAIKEIEQYYEINNSPSKKELEIELLPRLVAIYKTNEKELKQVKMLLGI